MKITFLEPLGIPQAQLKAMAEEAIGAGAELVYYDTRVEDVPTLIERSKDADCVILSNFKYGKDVISQCPNLKMICVAFTGVDHVEITSFPYLKLDRMTQSASLLLSISVGTSSTLVS